MRHELKCWPEYFEEIIARTKTCELRQDDRNFQVGDFLILKEYSPLTKQYSGNEVHAEVTHLLRFHPGLVGGFVLMSIKL